METYIDVKGGKLFCRSVGNGSPVLLVHGAGVDADFFLTAAERLSQNHTVISYDRRGYSRSIGSIGEQHFTSQVEDMHSVLTHFCADTRTAIVGCSAGASIALRFAAAYPECLDSLILHEPVTARFISPSGKTAEAAAKIKAAIDDNKPHKAMLLFLSDFYDACDVSPRLDEESLKIAESNLMYFIKNEYEHIFYDELPTLTVRAYPMHICVGEKHSLRFFSETAAQLAALYSAPLVAFPGSHNAARDMPSDFAAAVERVLQSK